MRTNWDSQDVATVRAALALGAKLEDSHARERYYIRSAVDNLRRSWKHREGLPNSEANSALLLACYTSVIKDFFEHRDPCRFRFESCTEVRTLLLDTAKAVLRVENLSLRADLSEKVRLSFEKAMNACADELRKRLNNPNEYDPVGTVALIEFRMRYAGYFYNLAERRVPEAIASFYLMRAGLMLPDYVAREELHAATKGLPNNTNEKIALGELRKDVKTLKATPYFQAWVNAFRAQFGALPKARERAGRPKLPTDPFKIEKHATVDRRATIYKDSYITRTPDELDRIQAATGGWPSTLVVFRPERMALHETIAAAVTRIQMADPPRFLSQHIFGKHGIFELFILPAARELAGQFEKDRGALESYVDAIMDDHFHDVNPDAEIGGILSGAIKSIMERIEATDKDERYYPRLVETRDVLRNRVADILLHRRYQDQVRKEVDAHVEQYLKEKSELRLPMKPNRGRIAWVTTGGPAAGKSSLDAMILREYRQSVGVSHVGRLCQVNPDHYRQFLLRKHPDAAKNVDYGSLTQLECGQVRDLILERLQDMINGGAAPDFWISGMAPDLERIGLAAKGDAKVCLYVVSCPVEGENGAVWRALQRAKNSPPDHEDYHRFIPTKDLLKGHRLASERLPRVIGEARRHDLRLFDTSADAPTLTATMDSHNREMRIFDAKAFVDFVKKAQININASEESAIYDLQPKDAEKCASELAREICKYLNSEVSLNFRYAPDELDDLKSNITREMDRELKRLHGKDKVTERQRARVAYEMIRDSQAETYMWAGHRRAVIRDFGTFMSSFQPALAQALIIEMGRQQNLLSIRDAAGYLILLVEKDKFDKEIQKAYNIFRALPDKKQHPASLSSKDACAVIQGAAAALEKLYPRMEEKYEENTPHETSLDTSAIQG
jgi:hypothetical protein